LQVRLPNTSNLILGLRAERHKFTSVDCRQSVHSFKPALVAGGWEEELLVLS
jgi:hypothetical protein